MSGQTEVQTSPQTDTSKTDTSKTDTSKTDTSKTDTSKTDTSKTDTSKTDTSKTDASKAEKKPNGGEELSAKGPRQSLAKKLDIWFEDCDSTKPEEKNAVATETSKRSPENIAQGDLEIGKKIGSEGGGEGNDPRKSSPQRIQNRLITSLSMFLSNLAIWHDFYGSLGALMMLLLGNESVWKTQMEVLRSPTQMGRPHGDPGGDPYDGPVGGGGDRRRRSSDDPGRDPPDPFWSGDDDFLDQAAREFKDIVQAESNRVSVAGAMIASVMITALGLGFLSQSHWVARAFWIASLVTALLSVFYAGNLVWRIGRLFSGRQVRAWIRRKDVTMLQVMNYTETGHQPTRRDIFCPDLSSVLAVSAPGILLAASLLFLLLGMGVYLGFVWKRALDTSSGSGDSRNVFIVYVVVLGVCYVMYSAVDIGQNYSAGLSVRSALPDYYKKLKTEWSRYIREQEQAMLEKEEAKLIKEKTAVRRHLEDVILQMKLARVLGADHPDMLTSMANLASTYRNQGRWEEAERLEVEVMERRKMVFGEEHPNTLTSMSNLAFTLKGQGFTRRAISLLEDYCRLGYTVFGSQHPNIVSSRGVLRTWQLELGDPNT